MISISRDELEYLPKIGSGKFGTVYKKDDELAYKIYHPTVSSYDGRILDNPALRLPWLRFHKLKQKGKKLQYTDVLKDVIYVNGHFGGVCLPYYNGTTLNHLLNESVSLKIDISKQLVRNGKELLDHYIYPIDYKLNNIFFTNGNVKIIDLDDYFTHVRSFKSPFLHSGAINGLSETVLTFFGEYLYLGYGSAVSNKLLRKPVPSSFHLEDLDSYLKNKEENFVYLLVNDTTDISEAKKYFSNGPIRIIYIFDGSKHFDNHYLLNIIQQYQNAGISLFDMVPYHLWEQYSHNYIMQDCLQLDNKSLKKLK